MLLDYVKDVGGIAFDKASLGVVMLEFAIAIITILVLFIFWLFRIKPAITPDTTSQDVSSAKKNLRKILEFLREDKLRILAVTVLFAGFFFLIYAPYEIYVRDQNRISDLNEQRNAATNHISFLNEEVQLWQEDVGANA